MRFLAKREPANIVKKFDRHYAMFKTAVAILEDKNLVWSSDFETIRRPLARWLKYQTSLGHNADPTAIEIAENLTNDEFDLTI